MEFIVYLLFSAFLCIIGFLLFCIASVFADFVLLITGGDENDQGNDLSR